MLPGQGKTTRAVERVDDAYEADERVLDHLARLGCDPSEPRETRHFLYLPAQGGADAVARRARRRRLVDLRRAKRGRVARRRDESTHAHAGRRPRDARAARRARVGARRPLRRLGSSDGLGSQPPRRESPPLRSLAAGRSGTRRAARRPRRRPAACRPAPTSGSSGARRRPTRLPLSRYWAQSSACRSHAEIQTKSAPPSFEPRSIASRKLATFFSSLTSRSSTSVARLPIRCTLFMNSKVDEHRSRKSQGLVRKLGNP